MTVLTTDTVHCIEHQFDYLYVTFVIYIEIGGKYFYSCWNIDYNHNIISKLLMSVFKSQKKLTS